MKRCAMYLLLFVLAAHPARAADPTVTLVLPLRSVGVSDETVVVTRDLLIGSLRDLGLVVSEAATTEILPAGSEACDDPACAAALGREHDAAQVVYGSISRLGSKFIVRLNVVRVDEATPYYRDQLTATSEEDLDTVMRRFAEGITSGRPNSDRASVESVIQAETREPPRRATLAGFGVRAGFLFPTGNSYGGADRLTSVLAAFRTEVGDYLIETTPILGFNWGDGNFDWTMLDVSVLRLFGKQDLTTYLGVGIGVHGVTVERSQIASYTYGTPPTTYTYPVSYQQSETAPTVDLVAGVMGLRTYDLSLVLELRFHYVFARFDEVGGDGANGLQLTFGTSRNRGAR